MPKTLTIRTQPEHDEALIRVGKMLGEKTAARTLLNSLMEYEGHREEIDRLREALRRMEGERDVLRSKIDRFKAAHAAMME